MSDRVIGVTLGDPGGIGPEVVLKALQKFLPLQKKGTFFLLLGYLPVLEKTAQILRLPSNFLLHNHFDPKLLAQDKINVLAPAPFTQFEIGKVDGENGKLAFNCVRVGAYMAAAELLDVLMTAPVSKEAIQKTVKDFHGHTEYLAQVAKVKNFAMMLQGGPLRVVLVTIHLPLKDVARAISSDLIVSKTELAHQFLKEELKRNPKIGVAGLNPHAGEGGVLGREDAEIIAPAVKKLQAKGMNVEGPLAADTIFRKAYIGQLDAVICMYHDQGLGPLKMIAFDEGINVTLGLPYRRSSPDHGTAFDIAYQGKANSLSTEKALEFIL